MADARHIGSGVRGLVLAGAAFLGLILTDSGAASSHVSCDVCHVSATPDAQNADLIMPEPQLCLSCHPDQTGPSNHVIGVTLDPGMPTSLPLTNGVMVCSTCHDLHSTNPTLIRSYPNGICFGCHQK